MRSVSTFCVFLPFFYLLSFLYFHGLWGWVFPMAHFFLSSTIGNLCFFFFFLPKTSRNRKKRTSLFAFNLLIVLESSFRVNNFSFFLFLYSEVFLFYCLIGIVLGTIPVLWTYSLSTSSFLFAFTMSAHVSSPVLFPLTFSYSSNVSLKRCAVSVLRS